jgi:hypothetical protein
MLYVHDNKRSAKFACETIHVRHFNYWLQMPFKDIQALASRLILEGDNTIA